jgi:hypothetical protein
MKMSALNKPEDSVLLNISGLDTPWPNKVGGFYWEGNVELILPASSVFDPETLVIAFSVGGVVLPIKTSPEKKYRYPYQGRYNQPQ